MTDVMKPAVVVLNRSATAMGQAIADAIDGSVHGFEPRVDEAEVPFGSMADHIRMLFEEGRAIVAVMASGALIRILAPLLSDKTTEPPVLAVSDDGMSVVPLLGGHHGANELATKIASVLNGHAAVTTAGDVRFGVSLDRPPDGFVLTNPGAAKGVMAALLGGASATLVGESDWLRRSAIPFADDAPVRFRVTDTVDEPQDNELLYAPQSLCLGVGCERGAPADEVIELAESALHAAGLSPRALAGVFSIDLKADEAAVHAVAGHFGVPARFFSAAELEAERDRLANPSEIVFAEVGCHGVAEGAALVAGGPDAVLIVEKQKSNRATCAITRARRPVNAANLGRRRGVLSIVGIGPGNAQWRSPEVTALVSQSTDLVGYSLYLDLLGTLTDGKTRHDFDLGSEEARVRHAMELAGQGRSVSLVCSGDAGIYAMATLAFELLDAAGTLQHGEDGLSDAARRIEIVVSPGISALQAAAARAGAPLGHDFCTISLSDLLTPWDDIKRRVAAAAEGDFVIAFYNPVSKRRRTQLAHARNTLLRHRPDDTPVILATNLGRDGETVRIVPLHALKVDDVDMLTVVVVGSSQSRTVTAGDGRTWVYTPRGYAAKPGTVIEIKEARQ
ncbi:MAG: precorrin-3B C(17)-methyltransferase [Alphaproteobacteria bacterium]|nr:precorrin-3B C(17)-methyltransferase [Alphaproteobacteria bacterium]